MILRVTVTYFEGRHADSQIHRDLTIEQAKERQDSIIESIRQAIQGNVILTLSGEKTSFAYPPGLLNQACIRFEILEDERA